MANPEYLTPPPPQDHDEDDPTVFIPIPDVPPERSPNPEIQKKLDDRKDKVFKETAAYIHAKLSKHQKQPAIPPEFPSTKRASITRIEWVQKIEDIRSSYHDLLIYQLNTTERMEDATSAQKSLKRLEMAAQELREAMQELGMGALEVMNHPLNRGIDYDRFVKAELQHLPIENTESLWTIRLQALADYAAGIQKWFKSTTTGGSISYKMHLGRTDPDCDAVWKCANTLNFYGVATEALIIKMLNAILQVEAPLSKTLTENKSRPLVRWFLKENPNLEYKNLND